MREPEVPAASARTSTSPNSRARIGEATSTLCSRDNCSRREDRWRSPESTRRSPSSSIQYVRRDQDAHEAAATMTYSATEPASTSTTMGTPEAIRWVRSDRPGPSRNTAPKARLGAAWTRGVRGWVRWGVVTVRPISPRRVLPGGRATRRLPPGSARGWPRRSSQQPCAVARWRSPANDRWDPP